MSRSDVPPAHAWPQSVARWELWVLAAILVLALVLRVAWPTLTEFKFSEARLAALALELTQEGRLPLVGVPSSAGFDHSPVSVYFYVPAFLFTSDPIPATIYGGLVNLAAVALCWWLARRWPGGGRWAAPVAALLFAVSPWSVAFSRKIWQVAFVPFLALVLAGLIVSALVKGREWHLAWALVVYALLVQVHPSAISLAVALLLWLVVFWRRVKLGPLLVGAALSLLTAVPFLLHQVQNGWPALRALRSLPDAVWDLTAVRLMWEAVTGRGIHALAGGAYPLLETVPQLGWVFNLIGWLVVAVALWLAWRMVKGWQSRDVERRQGAQVDLILLSWLLVPALFNLRHSLDLHLHFFALILPVAYLLVGRAVQSVRAYSLARWLKAVGLVSIGLVAVAQVVALILMARFVSSHETAGGFGISLARYQAVADGALAAVEELGANEVLVVGPGNSIVVDDLPAIFDVLLRDRVAYRFVDGDKSAVFPPYSAVALLSPGAGEASALYLGWPVRELPDGYRLVALDGSWPQEGFSPAAGPGMFQNGVAVQGYHGAFGSGSAEAVRLWLSWQVLWLDAADTHFAVRLVDEVGQVRGQQDAVGYPTAYRQKGDRIISLFDITLSPPSGQLESIWAQTGMYTYPDIVGVPVIDEAGNPVDHVVVLGRLGEQE